MTETGANTEIGTVPGIGNGDGDWPSRKRAWYVAAILIFAFTVAYIDRVVISLLVVPIQRDLNLTDTQFSFLQGLAFAAFYTLAGLPLGRLADTTKSRRNILAICAVSWGVMTMACGLAKNYTMMFLARVGIGIGEGGLPASSLSILSDYFPEDKLTLPIGLFVGGTYIGGGLAFIVGGAIVDMVSGPGSVVIPLIGELKPWQLVFLAVGSLGLLAALAILTIKEPKRHGRIQIESDGTEKSAPNITLRQAAKYAWANKKLYGYLFFGTSFLGIYGAGLIGWIPAHFYRNYNWTESQFGYAFGTIFFVAGILGTVVASRIEVSLRRRGYEDAKLRIMVVSALAVFPFGIIAPYMANPWVSLAMFGIVIFLESIPVALTPSSITSITPNQLRGQISALYLFVIAIVGIGLGPTIVAVTTDFVFGNQAAVRHSLALIGVIMSIVSATLLFLAIKPYRAEVHKAKAWISR